ncbi:CAMK family protein kinase [Tritrichomonas foetus]|uniref:CAMK family protein kinase n=1 Tax=Tritrichomonas foetus TaxID=1144522 RepID=A0A1J4JS99_9EUKA|nr:CAMK family protein kinase [Tritrichomonas foetus]|eukprot:OHT00125.1 CAMK family protein kinase [Tritrichomonas foetus]
MTDPSAPIIGSLLPDRPQNIQIGDYILKHRLGAGKFGSVFHCVSEKYKCDFAIKIITKIADPNAIDLFRREALTLKSVCHPNVVRLYDFFEDVFNFYIVMEYCPNGTLLNLIQNKGYLSKPMIQFYFIPIIQALEFCHSRGIVHRDLKPDNILIDVAGRPKIGDWGQSRPFTKQALLTTYCGTISYVAPELHMKRPYDGPKCDMWSLGVILFAAATGRMPWKSQTQTGKVSEIVNMRYSIPPKVDAEIADVIRSLIVFDPNGRATAEELLSKPIFHVESRKRHSFTPPPQMVKAKGIPIHHVKSALRKTGLHLTTVVPVRAKLSAKATSVVLKGTSAKHSLQATRDFEKELAKFNIA